MINNIKNTYSHLVTNLYKNKGIIRNLSLNSNNYPINAMLLNNNLKSLNKKLFQNKTKTKTKTNNIYLSQTIRNMELYAKHNTYNKYINRNLNKNTKLIVCDMAGTIINENGIVYDSLYKSIKDTGYFDINRDDINEWHGIFKNKVIEYFVTNKASTSCPLQKDELFNKINNNFTEILHEAYFSEDSKISLIDANLLEFFENLRINDIKISLNTGYTSDIQTKLINKFNLNDHVDYYISSDKVKYGRPYPYMIYTIMEQLEIENINTVAKIGDSVNDIYEGKNAGCGQLIGVLSGAASKNELISATATTIVEDITKLTL